MGNALGVAFYITVCCIAFVTSKVVISVLCYKRWRKKQQLFYGDSFTGLSLFRVLLHSPGSHGLYQMLLMI